MSLPAPTRIGRTFEVQERTYLDELRMETRVANLDGLRLANEMRAYGRRLQFVGVRDDSLEARQLGVEIEARGNRYIRQRPSAK